MSELAVKRPSSAELVAHSDPWGSMSRIRNQVTVGGPRSWCSLPDADTDDPRWVMMPRPCTPSGFGGHVATAPSPDQSAGKLKPLLHVGEIYGNSGAAIWP